MSKTVVKDRKIFLFSLVVAATTVIAGIMHLQMTPSSLSEDLGRGILFLVGGALQIFWAIPVIKQWGRIWQIIGITGTAVFFILWYADRLHLIPESHILGGSSHIQPREFPRGNFTGGESPRGNFTRGEFPRGGPMRGPGLQIGGILLPPIEMFQLAFIGLYAALSKTISRNKKI
jgi:hypothetical protein